MVISGQPWPEGSPFKGVHIFFAKKQPNSSVKPSPATSPEPATKSLPDKMDSSETPSSE